MMKLTDKQLKGSYPPLVTQFKDDGSVDYDTYAKLVEFQVKGGTHGIVVTGTTGEPSILTTDERIELVKGDCEIAVPLQVDERRRGLVSEVEAVEGVARARPLEEGWAGGRAGVREVEEQAVGFAGHEVEVAIVDPVRVVQAQRHFSQPPSQRRQQR